MALTHPSKPENHEREIRFQPLASCGFTHVCALLTRDLALVELTAHEPRFSPPEVTARMAPSTSPSLHNARHA